MDGLLLSIESAPLSQWVERSRWGFGALNIAHIFGFALVVGAMTALSLNRLGLFRGIQQGDLSRAITPVAGVGLAIALVTGALMFAADATLYAGAWVFRIKIVLVAIGTLNAVILIARYGLHLQRLSPRRRAAHAVISLGSWTLALVLGRIVAFIT